MRHKKIKEARKNLSLFKIGHINSHIDSVILYA
nr:MAG TPA: hypothetical protein [Caudoviricetes sp.]